MLASLLFHLMERGEEGGGQKRPRADSNERALLERETAKKPRAAMMRMENMIPHLREYIEVSS